MKKLQDSEQAGNKHEGISTEGYDAVISFTKGTTARVEKVLTVTWFKDLKWNISPEGLVRDEKGKYITASGAKGNPIVEDLDNIHIDGKTLREIPHRLAYEMLLFADKNFVYRLKKHEGAKPEIISIRPDEFKQIEGYYYVDGVNVYLPFRAEVYPGNPDEFKVLDNGQGIFKPDSDKMGLDHNSVRSLGKQYYTDASGKIIFRDLGGNMHMVEGNPDASKFTSVDINSGEYLYTDGKNDYCDIYPVSYVNVPNGMIVRKVRTLTHEFTAPVYDNELDRLLQGGMITKEMTSFYR